jgi:ankyrin repeat protein
MGVLTAFSVSSAWCASSTDLPRPDIAQGKKDLVDRWYGRTPLMRAALEGDTAAAIAWLDQGAAVNARDKNGMTALMWTAPEVAPLLLARGADVSAIDHFGRSALSYAAYLGDEARVRALLDAGTAVDGRDRNGWTPLFFAVAGGTRAPWPLHQWQNWVLADLAGVRSKEADAYRQVIRLLLRRGATVDARDRVGRTPLLLLLRSSTPSSRLGGPLLIYALLEHGADVSALSAPEDYDGKTPLMWAAWKDDTAAVEALLAYGAAVNARDKNGMTALMWASSEAAPLLLARGADPRARDQFGRTPLSYAAYQGDVPRVRTLLSLGLPVDDRDLDGLTPLFFALDGECGRFGKGRREPKERVLSILRKVQRRGVGEAVVKLLLDRGADVNTRDKKGRTPLIYFSQRNMFPGGQELVEYLLAKGADVNAADVDGYTALIWRAGWGDAPLVELLLKHGAAARAQTRNGETALSLSSRMLNLGDKARVTAILQAAAGPDEEPGARTRSGRGGSRSVVLDGFPSEAVTVDEAEVIEIARQTIAAREAWSDRAIYSARRDGNGWVVSVLRMRGYWSDGEPQVEQGGHRGIVIDGDGRVVQYHVGR